MDGNQNGAKMVSYKSKKEIYCAKRLSSKQTELEESPTGAHNTVPHRKQVNCGRK